MSDAVIEFPLGQVRQRAAMAADRHLSGTFEKLRAAWLRDGPLGVERRAAVLTQLDQALRRYKDALVQAVAEDFGHRSAHETLMADIYATQAGIRHAVRHFRRWMRPRTVGIDLLFRPGRGRVEYQALGVVGIISPWNYPVQLSLTPLAAAVAAGNRVLLKPSEYTPRTAALLERILSDIFDNREVAVLTGGADLAHAVAHLPFDHLFFTGSSHVGRQVMRSASDNLVPVTLELGGKSPVIIAPDYPLQRAADSIMAGKLLNAGQTCIAPDYVLLPRGREMAFVEACAGAVARLYPTLADNPDYTAIINDRHYQRLVDLLDDARRRGARVHPLNPQGENFAPQGGRMVPALLTGTPEPAAIMQQEIFGPLLPLVPYTAPADAIAYINERPRPLALYLFSDNRDLVRQVLDRTLSGGVTLNDTLLHAAQAGLPFGGVGASGMGAYHGEAGFRTFSHARAIFSQSRFSPTGLIRPPYGRHLDRLLRWLIGR
jgi:acyl-CoA reductase-like NAD-dependent aldehyde dehydrogenase